MRVLFLALAMIAAPAAAVTFDPGTPDTATVDGIIEVGGVQTQFDTFGTHNVGSGTVTVTAAPVAAVTTTVETLAGSISDVGAFGLLNYDYLVKVGAVGTAQNVILNLVTIDGISKVTRTGVATGYVQAVSGANQDGTSQSFYNDGTINGAFQMSGAGKYVGSVDNGDGTQSFVYRGSLGLFAGGRAFAGGAKTVAMIDPLITINSSSLQNAELTGPATLILSSGIANAAAVPEPAGWALTIGGFGLVGAASRRRRAAFA